MNTIDSILKDKFEFTESELQDKYLDRKTFTTREAKELALEYAKQMCEQQRILCDRNSGSLSMHVSQNILTAPLATDNI